MKHPPTYMNPVMSSNTGNETSPTYMNPVMSSNTCNETSTYLHESSDV